MLRWKRPKGTGASGIIDHRRAADNARVNRRFGDAAQAYEQMIAARPDDGSLYVQCGHMHKENGDLVRAEESYMRALSLLPDDADLHNQLGHFFKISGSLDRALQYYLRAAELKPDWREPREEAEVLRFRYPSLATAVAARPSRTRSGKPAVYIEFIGKR